MKPLFVLVLSMLLAAPAMAAQDCAGEYRQKVKQMLAESRKCKADPTLVAALEAGKLIDDHGACSDGTVENPAFNSCARVYLCAARTYNCTIYRFGQGDTCDDAAVACMSF